MLVQTIQSVVNRAVNNKEHYTNSMTGGKMLNDYTGGELLVTLITLVIVYLLILVLGKYLWNNVFVKVFTIAKPITSIWQLFALVVLFSLLFQR